MDAVLATEAELSIVGLPGVDGVERLVHLWMLVRHDDVGGV